MAASWAGKGLLRLEQDLRIEERATRKLAWVARKRRARERRREAISAAMEEGSEEARGGGAGVSELRSTMVGWRPVERRKGRGANIKVSG